MAAEEPRLTEQQGELVALGASIGAGCQPCASYHLKAGAKTGVSAERLLAAVVNAELAAAEAAERLTDHVREQFGSEVREPKATSPLDEVFASLGGALGANDLANVRRRLLVAQQLGASRPQLMQAIEIARAVQDNSTRMHFRSALQLLDRVAGPEAATAGQDAAGAGSAGAASSEDPAAAAATHGAPDFMSMMARLVALSESCDGAVLQEKMAQCFAIFEPCLCPPSACDCAASSGPCEPSSL